MIDEGKRETGLGKGCLWCGILFFLFFLILHVPANRAYPLLVNSFPGGGRAVALSGLEGTWLSGSAREGVIGPIPVRQVRWAFKPSLTTWGQADLEFRSGKDGYFAGRLAAGLGGRLMVTDLQARLSLALFDEIIGGPSLEVAGLAGAALDRLEFEGGRLQVAEGTLICSGLEVIRPYNLMLGDFKIELTTTGEEVKAVISDGGGPLAINGVLLLQPDGMYSFSGSAAARQDELAPVLRMLGKSGADGTVAINHRGAIPPLL